VAGASRLVASVRPGDRLQGFFTLQSLPRNLLAVPVEAEVSAATVVGRWRDDSSGWSRAERTAASMAEYALMFRNGAATALACAQAFEKSVVATLLPLIEGQLDGQEGVAAAVAESCCANLTMELGSKFPSVRQEIGRYINKTMRLQVKLKCSADRCKELLPLLLQVADSDDPMIASAAFVLLGSIFNPRLQSNPELVGTLLSCGTVRAALRVEKRLGLS
jgi:hypothetical protein